MSFFTRQLAFSCAWAEYYLQQNKLDGAAHEQTIVCRQLLAGHVVGSQQMKRKEKNESNVNGIYYLTQYWYTWDPVNPVSNGPQKSGCIDRVALLKGKTD